MRRIAFLLTLLLFLVIPAFGQSTTVTGTVQDSNGNLYSNGTVSTVLTGTGAAPTQSGVAIPISTGPFPINNAGVFTIAVADVTTLSPSGFQYVFTFCGISVNLGPAVPQVRTCFDLGPIPISGVSVNITAQISAVPPNILGPLAISPGAGTITNPSGPLAPGAPTVAVSPTGIATINNTVDEAFMSGGDVCLRINSAWQVLLANNPTVRGGTVTVRVETGILSCAAASNPFANYPPGGQFNGRLEIEPTAQILISAGWILPNGLIIDLKSQHAVTAVSSGTPGGGVIQASNTFPINTPLITVGVGIENTSVINGRLSCVPPSGVAITGSTAYYNPFGQENSRLEDMFIDGCDAFGFDVSTAQSQNSGVYRNIAIAMRGVNNANAQCFRIGSSVNLAIMTSLFEQISCGGVSNAVEPNALATVDAASVVLISPHFEEGTRGLIIGSQKFSHAVTVIGAQCSATALYPMTDCINLSSSPGSDGVVVIGTYSLGGTHVTNLLTDAGTNGGSVPDATQTSLAYYSREVGNSVCTTSSAISNAHCNMGGGSSASLQTDGVANAAQNLLNLITSVTNTLGLTATPTNTSGGIVKYEIAGLLNVLGGGTGVSNPTAHALAVGEGTLPHTYVPCNLTGQVLTGAAGADPSCLSPGVTGRVVSGGSDSISCDSGTATVDRGLTIIYTTVSSFSVVVPQAGTAGCTGGFAFAVAVSGAGATITFTPTVSTMIVLHGTTAASGQTSVAVSTGNFCTFNSYDNANYLVRCDH